LLAASIAVILELCSLQAPSFMAKYTMEATVYSFQLRTVSSSRLSYTEIFSAFCSWSWVKRGSSV
jgi:hypothetical protein